MPAKQKATINEDGSPAATAAQFEADDEDQPIKVEYGGNTYEIDPKAGRSLAFRAAVQSGEDTAVIAALLGPVQWRQFLAVHGNEDGIDAVNGLSDAFTAAVGSGNS